MVDKSEYHLCYGVCVNIDQLFNQFEKRWNMITRKKCDVAQEIQYENKPHDKALVYALISPESREERCCMTLTRPSIRALTATKKSDERSAEKSEDEKQPTKKSRKESKQSRKDKIIEAMNSDLLDITIENERLIKENAQLTDELTKAHDERANPTFSRTTKNELMEEANDRFLHSYLHSYLYFYLHSYLHF
jgi:hypothetical protein